MNHKQILIIHDFKNGNDQKKNDEIGRWNSIAKSLKYLTICLHRLLYLNCFFLFSFVLLLLIIDSFANDENLIIYSKIKIEIGQKKNIFLLFKQQNTIVFISNALPLIIKCTNHSSAPTLNIKKDTQKKNDSFPKCCCFVITEYNIQ